MFYDQNQNKRFFFFKKRFFQSFTLRKLINQPTRSSSGGVQ